MLVESRVSPIPWHDLGGPREEASIGRPQQPRQDPHCAIGVFARVPIPGRTKTRLVPRLGPEGAARFYVASLLDTCDLVTSTGMPWVTFSAPSRGVARLRHLGVESEILGQGRGGLGLRMERALTALLSRPGIGRALLVGTDSPDLPSDLLHDADAALRRAPTVLAPAADGGFVLIGISAEARSTWKPGALLRGIPWSRPETFRATRARLAAFGLDPTILRTWCDVDEPEDLLALHARLSTSRELGTLSARRTDAVLSELLATEEWVGSSRLDQA